MTLSWVSFDVNFLKVIVITTDLKEALPLTHEEMLWMVFLTLSNIKEWRLD